MNTSVSELTASMTTTAVAMSIATSAGPESSFRPASVGCGVISSRSLSAMG